MKKNKISKFKKILWSAWNSVKLLSYHSLAWHDEVEMKWVCKPKSNLRPNPNHNLNHNPKPNPNPNSNPNESVVE